MRHSVHGMALLQRCQYEVLHEQKCINSFATQPALASPCRHGRGMYCCRVASPFDTVFCWVW
jgi:hypothetical protein